MAKVTITVASCNTPQGHHDVIRNSPVKRAVVLRRLLNKEDVDVICMQEYGPALTPGWKRGKNWSVVEGANNNRPNQRKAYNAIAYRNDRLRVLDTRQLSFRLPGRSINMPVVLFEDKVTKVAFVVIGVHVPTRRDATARKRLAINARLIAYALRCERRGYPVIVAGDRNDGHLLPWVKPFKRGVQHQVDWVLGSASVAFTGGKKIYSVFKTVSDHPAMVLVKAHLKGSNTTSDDLP